MERENLDHARGFEYAKERKVKLTRRYLVLRRSWLPSSVLQDGCHTSLLERGMYRLVILLRYSVRDQGFRCFKLICAYHMSQVVY